ncbi:MAG: DoxX family protein [Chlorobi bacterium]|nr:DoxX family protein [Chlorobiota bacterium]MCI0716063.1 DoxX family protein [Chlorobiota bacterium]
MYILSKIDAWAERHHPKWIDVLRILLGLILLYKGLYFISNTQAIVALLQNTEFELWAITIAHYVVAAHIMGGLLIAIGLLTRVAVLFQVPVLLGAIIFVNLPKGLLSFNSETELSVLVLFLLVFFLIEGSGPLSVDEFVKKHPEDK